jgi:hypothetical protein
MARAPLAAPSLILPRPRKLTFGNKAQELNARRGQLDMERSTYLTEWAEIADYARVRKSRALSNSTTRKRSRTNKVLNEAMQFASRTAGAGMIAGVSSPSRPWLRMGTPDRELNEYKSAKLWLDDTTRVLLNIFAQSNYYHVKQQSFTDMADFGQGPTLIDEDYEDVISLYCSSPGEYFLSVDDKGRVDTQYRDLQWTTQQCVQKFGYAACPMEVQRDYDVGNYDTLWDIGHAVEPNRGMVKGERGPVGMPWKNVYWARSCSEVGDNAIFRVSGYSENPISAARWNVEGNDVYGDGPGAMALPGGKSLQATEKRTGQLVDKSAVPPLQAPTTMRRETITHVPGQVSYYPQSNGSPDVIRPTYAIDPNAIRYTMEVGDKLEDRISRAYFADLFLRLSYSDRRDMTAREVEEIHEEKLIALGPVLERTHYEGLNVEIRRTIAIAKRKGVLLPPPPELNGAELRVEYTSILAVAQRAVGIGALERFSGYVGTLAAADPQVLDKWDLDQTVDEYADMTGIPASVVRSDAEVKQRREQRAKDMQQEQQMAQVAQAAEVAKTASQADTGRRDNLLADIIGNQGRII